MIVEILTGVAAPVGTWISVLWRCDNCRYQARAKVQKGVEMAIKCTKCGQVDRFVA